MRSSCWQTVVYTTIVDFKKKEKKRIFKFEKLNFEGCWQFRRLLLFSSSCSFIESNGASFLILQHTMSEVSHLTRLTKLKHWNVLTASELLCLSSDYKYIVSNHMRLESIMTCFLAVPIKSVPISRCDMIIHIGRKSNS